jgi:hypothetical protein
MTCQRHILKQEGKHRKMSDFDLEFLEMP